MATGGEVMNPLLTYVAHRISTDTAVTICQVCVEFYSADEIVKARDTLWSIQNEAIKGILGQMTKRKNLNARRGCEATMSDIIDGVAKLDAKDKTPRFTVDFLSLARVPRAPPTEGVNFALLTRVARLEEKMEAMERKPVRSDPTAKPRRPTSVAAPSYSMNTASGGETLVKSVDEQVDDTDDDGFIKPKRRRRKRPVVGRANCEGPLMGAPEPSRDIFVYRVLPATPTEAVTQYLDKEKVTVREIKQVSKETALYKSFRIKIPSSELSKVLSPDFWPAGICVRRFFTPKEKPPTE